MSHSSRDRFRSTVRYINQLFLLCCQYRLDAMRLLLLRVVFVVNAEEVGQYNDVIPRFKAAQCGVC
jgi:hypothetical protein